MDNKKIVEYIENNSKKYRNEYSQFVLNNSLLFYNIACVEINKLYGLQQFKNIKSTYDVIDIGNSFNIACQFFKIHNIRINIKELYDKKILVFFNDDKKRNDQFISNNLGPTSYQGYNKERGHFIEIFISNNILDAFAIIHEVTHHMNQPEGPRSVISDMLTESISYGMEFIFAQSLINENFKADEAKLFIWNCHMEVLNYAYTMAPIFRVLHVYNNCKKVDDKNYYKLFPSGNYENDLSQFEKYIEANRDYIRDTWNYLGRSISTYIYDKYRKDPECINKLLKLNDAINYMSFEYCLKIIDINNSNDLFYKITDALEENNNYIINKFKK